MAIDLDECVNKYFHVSRKEMEDFIRRCGSEDWVESLIKDKHDDRETEKQHGRPSLRPQPLAQIMSLTVKPNQEEDNKQLALHGTIYAHYIGVYKTPITHQIYKRDVDDVPDILGIDGSLTLNGPDYLCHPDHAYLHLIQSSRVDVNLYDQTNNIFAGISFYLDNDIDNSYYEQVKSMVIPCQQGSLTLHYIAIPFGIHSRLQVTIPMTKEQFEKHEIYNVNGKIVARYTDTYGNYSAQECVLFKKQDDEFERVESGHVKLSRCWVSLPAYSSLIIEVDLSEFGSRRKIGKCTKKLLPRQGLMSVGSLLSGDMDIWVGAAWFSPDPFGRIDYRCSTSLPQIPAENLKQNIEEMDTDGEDKSSADDDGESTDDDDTDGDDESSMHAFSKEKKCSVSFDDGESLVADESGDVLSSSLNRGSWCLRSHKNIPRSSFAVEIFSVFIGREKSKPVQIYGSIEVLREDRELCYIFKRDENEALMLSEDLKFIPIPDGSRAFSDCSSLKMKFDIKDIEGCLAIKGYVDWAASTLDSPFWYKKQLCNLIQGQKGGFASVHYSIFEYAVCVTIKVLLKFKTGSSDVNPKVWGSLVTQYSRHDYSSRYKKDNYRCVLFNRTQDDLVQISNDSTIPLSRSTIVVPSYSSLIVDIDLSGFSEQKLSCVKMIKIGEGFKTVETNDYLFHIELDWCKVK
ncbi:uncharacterized protein LOC123890775 [Trifolium pratense]|uniref:uncharacterized protein LOC123890775 n=1 Tax=Trifolium pratense TaxID=57577 RepID=UPI001E69325A|nr:uncharacterized protein LOC123890775 [Trifolium pratense]